MNLKKIKSIIKIILYFLGIVVTILTLIQLILWINTYLNPLRVFPKDIAIKCDGMERSIGIYLENVYSKPIYNVNFIATIESPNYTISDYSITAKPYSIMQEQLGELSVGTDIIQYSFISSTEGFPCIQTVIEVIKPKEIIPLKLSYKNECTKGKIKLSINHFDREGSEILIPSSSVAKTFNIYCNNDEKYNIQEVNILLIRD